MSKKHEPWGYCEAGPYYVYRDGDRGREYLAEVMTVRDKREQKQLAVQLASAPVLANRVNDLEEMLRLARFHVERQAMSAHTPLDTALRAKTLLAQIDALLEQGA